MSEGKETGQSSDKKEDKKDDEQDANEQKHPSPSKSVKSVKSHKSTKSAKRKKVVSEDEDDEDTNLTEDPDYRPVSPSKSLKSHKSHKSHKSVKSTKTKKASVTSDVPKTSTPETDADIATEDEQKPSGPAPEEKKKSHILDILRPSIISSHSKRTAAESPERPKAEIREKSKVEILEKPKAEIPEKPKAEIPDKPIAESQEKPKVDIPEKPKADIPEKPRVESPRKSKAESPRKSKAESPRKSKAESPEKPKAEILKEPKADALEKPKTQSATKLKEQPPLPTKAVPSDSKHERTEHPDRHEHHETRYRYSLAQSERILPSAGKQSMILHPHLQQLSSSTLKTLKDKSPSPTTMKHHQSSSPARVHRGVSDRSLHTFVAASHAALTSAKATGSRFAIQFDTPLGEEIERNIWKKKLSNGTLEPINLNETLAETKFGVFHILLYISCGIIYMACSASLTTLSFTLPASACDLEIGSVGKGMINCAPYVGMLIGTFVWGSISDSQGRKTALIMSLLLDSIAGVISGFSNSKYFMLIFRTFNGFSIIGATSLVFAYFGEFLTENQGELLLPAIEFFYCLGMVYIPASAYALIPLNINLGSKESFFYHSWNLFTSCASIPSIIGVSLLFFFPESPKFNFMTGKLEKSYMTMKKMYACNTRKPSNQFPVVCALESNMAHDLAAEKRPKFFTLIKQQFIDVYNSHKELFGVHKYRTLLCCFIDFSFNFGYLTMVIWLPELLERRAQYHETHHGYATVCKSSEALLQMSKHGNQTCRSVNHETYQHGLIMTSSSIPVVACAFLALRWISKHILLSILLVITGTAIMLFYFVKHPVILVFNCSAFESCATLLETLMFICIVEMFPTQIAGTALAVTACSGRFAAILGNIFIGYTLDSNCSVPLFTFGTFFFTAAVMSFFLPVKKN